MFLCPLTAFVRRQLNVRIVNFSYKEDQQIFTNIIKLGEILIQDDLFYNFIRAGLLILKNIFLSKLRSVYISIITIYYVRISPTFIYLSIYFPNSICVDS